MRNILLVTTALISSTAFGAEAEETYRLTVSRGEAITVFRVEKRGTKNFLVVSEQSGRQTERSLRPDDLAYLNEKVSAVPAAKEAGCGRAHFALAAAATGSEIKACGERLSATGKALQALANLLAAYR
ncbi:MAG: hypothetical protein EOP11_05280 [Proteobacteria bacterium]|nr:MAG: hypothetical protein EOP11_05280 [Pseudomonadota bacterium]